VQVAEVKRACMSARREDRGTISRIRFYIWLHLKTFGCSNVVKLGLISKCTLMSNVSSHIPD
jgi:hypothetical protein